MGRDSLRAYVGVAAIVAGILIPLLVLAPLGWLWLWQRGYALYFLGGMLVVSLGVAGARAWLISRIARELDTARLTEEAERLAGSPRETAARDAVERLARDVDPERITDRESLATLAIETVEAVARQMHPGLEHPVWNFTVPEALTLIERVSQRLRPMVIESVPLGDRLTVGQAMRLYEWRGLIDVATRAYDIYRLLRLANPAAAVTQEIRERLSKHMYQGLREELARRLLGAYVREVGRAAIDLYSGRLAVPKPEADFAAAETADSEAPLRILLAGQSGSGKSSLVNALSAEVKAAADALPQTRAFTSYEVQREGLPPVVLIDSPGLARTEDTGTIAARAAECDVLVWVAAADRPDRALDRAALESVRRHIAQHPDRPEPPVLVVLTHIDRLRPFQEWSPPYDIAAPDGAKSRSIRAAIDAAAEDLARPVASIVPVCASPERGSYNVELVWARIAEVLPAAKSAQLVRRIAGARAGGLDWRRVVGQAVSAGRLAADVLMRGGKSG